MSGRSTTIHWHGHRQVGTPWYDGVPMVTQCPINECEIFRYILTTDDPGLNFYHSHDGKNIFSINYQSLVQFQRRNLTNMIMFFLNLWYSGWIKMTSQLFWPS